MKTGTRPPPHTPARGSDGGVPGRPRRRPIRVLRCSREYEVNPPATATEGTAIARCDASRPVAGARPLGAAPLTLVPLTDPLGLGGGRLDVALGDFNGDEVSELAVSSRASMGHGRDLVTIWAFQVVGDSPINATVTAVPLSKPFVPQGF